MNTINRLEENWTPSWELGLQDEFGFSLEVETLEEPKLKQDRPNPWSMAKREVLNRQIAPELSLAEDTGKVGELISFLENLSMEIANDE
ncbi:hypothetical protein [Pelagicoccus mobilis]|uniref:Uncharacterized protein n=1 Tax=Pelagicoccus mobilis TaxID=415221 RepID=A0A934VQA3_9BACT|nr:hypothetical protein [Pelagicoccus mobilis]MBK1878137.1 hypothetical protein [Pelagicoccus mobilis]